MNLSREQALTYLWQRYRDKWPVARKMHKTSSATGRITYYYTEVDGMVAAPGWGWYVNEQTGQFEMKIINYLGIEPIKRSDLPTK